MDSKKEKIHTIDMVFPLIFILFFGCCTLFLVLAGAGVHEKTTEGLQKNYTVRTAGAYLQAKIREYSSKDQIEIMDKGDRQILALYETGEAEGYVTYIYLEDGKLCELFTKKGREIPLRAGQELTELSDFWIVMREEDLMEIHLACAGEKERILMRIYGDEGK
ncbi:MAG: DUF4860 domain-containing protein [Lachnospiraceae bacterium]|nr:DUF4860 domain-containing protein [Lachnospiraceae bacterium]MDY5496592.1 DUF4860 domain-containing protein [Anaerobutyricum sp.]